MAAPHQEFAADESVVPPDEQATAELAVIPKRRVRPILLVVAEIALALGASAGLAYWCASIDVNPLVRIGQVSGLAGLQLRLACIGIGVIGVVMIVARLGGHAVVPLITRCGSATLAGLGSGVLAGGVLLALHGTRLPFTGGDSANITKWAQTILDGHPALQPFYPPGPVYVVAWWAHLTGTNVEFAFKDLEVIGAGLFGPVAYLSWRLLLRPLPALAVGVVSALPMVELYKPYENLVLIALIPVLAKLLQVVRTAGDRRYLQLVPAGVVFGAVLGVFFLSYSGWFVWSTPGFGLALLLLLPWRRGLLKALTVVAGTGGVLVAICFQQITALLTASHTVKDTYFYIATWIDPTYIAMWQGPPPGDTTWPPPGELAGVGVFTLVLFAGLAAALYFGLRETVVITAVCCLAGAWVLRFLYASEMYQQQAVQLYPRTTIEILYCLLVLTLVAVMLGWGRIRGRWPHVVSGRALPTGVIGAFCALLLVLGSAGSATVNSYLPHQGNVAWFGQTSRMPDGHCSKYLAADCRTVIDTRRH